MFPFFISPLRNQKPLTREQNNRVFKILGVLIAVIIVLYVIFSMLVFGHL